MKNDFITVGGDFNFTALRHVEVNGESIQEDHLASFLLRKLVTANLCDINLAKIAPTCRNYKEGNVEVSKRLNHFVVS